MDKSKQIERKIEKIKNALMELGDMRPGSLTVQTRSWGGEYHQLSIWGKVVQNMCRRNGSKRSKNR